LFVYTNRQTEEGRQIHPSLAAGAVRGGADSAAAARDTPRAAPGAPLDLRDAATRASSAQRDAPVVRRRSRLLLAPCLTIESLLI